MSCCVGNTCHLWEATNSQPFIAPPWSLAVSLHLLFYCHLLPMLPPLHCDAFVVASVCIVAQMIFGCTCHQNPFLHHHNMEPAVCCLFLSPPPANFVTVAVSHFWLQYKLNRHPIDCSPFLLIFSPCCCQLCYCCDCWYSLRGMIANVDTTTPQHCWWHCPTSTL